MNTTQDDGGPAFPFVMPDPSTCHTEQGMSLRDWFAGMALPWALENRDVSQPFKHACAVAAYEIADAMLDARKEAR